MRPLESRKTLFDVKVNTNLSELSYDKLLDEIWRQAERPISDVMRPISATVDLEDHLVKIIDERVDRGLSLLPVLQEGKGVGVVRSVDAFREIAEILL